MGNLLPWIKMSDDEKNGPNRKKIFGQCQEQYFK